MANLYFFPLESEEINNETKNSKSYLVLEEKVDQVIYLPNYRMSLVLFKNSNELWLYSGTAKIIQVNHSAILGNFEAKTPKNSENSKKFTEKVSGTSFSPFSPISNGKKFSQMSISTPAPARPGKNNNNNVYQQTLKKQFQKQHQNNNNFNHLREPDLFPFIFEQVFDNDKILLVSRKNSKDKQIFDLGQILPGKEINSEIFKAFEGLESYSEFLVSFSY